VDLFVVNTDIQHLTSLSVPNKIQIGEKVTRGLGAGARPEVGEQAALEDIDKIKDVLRNTDMLFLAVGLGGWWNWNGRRASDRRDSKGDGYSHRGSGYKAL